MMNLILSTFFHVWHLWIVLAILFVVLEIFTLGFAVFCFAVGSLASAVCAAFDLSLNYQLLAFAVGSAVAFLTIRPLVLKYFFRNNVELKTGADALIGKRGKVTEAIEADGNGRVMVGGDDWKAVSETGEAIEKGAMVEIVGIESIILTVKKI